MKGLTGEYWFDGVWKCIAFSFGLLYYDVLGHGGFMGRFLFLYHDDCCWCSFFARCLVIGNGWGILFACEYFFRSSFRFNAIFYMFMLLYSTLILSLWFWMRYCWGCSMSYTKYWLRARVTQQGDLPDRTPHRNTNTYVETTVSAQNRCISFSLRPDSIGITFVCCPENAPWSGFGGNNY